MTKITIIFQGGLGLLLTVPKGPVSVECLGLLGKMLHNLWTRLTHKTKAY